MQQRGRSWHITIDIDSSLARNMMPNADIIVELVESETNRLKYRVLLNMFW